MPSKYLSMLVHRMGSPFFELYRLIAVVCPCAVGGGAARQRSHLPWIHVSMFAEVEAASASMLHARRMWCMALVHGPNTATSVASMRRSTFEDCWAFVNFVATKYKDREMPVAQPATVAVAE